MEISVPLIQTLVFGWRRDLCKHSIDDGLFGLKTRISLGFVDTEVNDLLYLDESKEAAIAIIPGKIYLSPYAQELVASGSTFYDDAVTEFFSACKR